MRLSQEPDDLFASMVQRRFTEALLDAKLIAPAAELDTGDLWVESAEHAPAAPVDAPKVVPWAQTKHTEPSRHFTPRLSLPTER
jgi:hypothetical protein